MDKYFTSKEMKKKQYISPAIVVMAVESESLMVNFSAVKVGNVSEDDYVPYDELQLYQRPEGYDYEYGEVEID